VRRRFPNVGLHVVGTTVGLHRPAAPEGGRTGTGCCVEHSGGGGLNTMSLAVPESGEKSTDDEEIYFGFVEWCTGRGIDLYPAQEDAVLEAVAGSNVIVSTPTGSGKSLV